MAALAGEGASASAAAAEDDQLSCRLQSASLSDKGPDSFFPAERFRWRDEWNSDGRDRWPYWPSIVFRDPAGVAVNVQGEQEKLAQHVLMVLEQIMSLREPLQLPCVTLTQQEEPGGILSWASKRGDSSHWPQKYIREHERHESSSGIIPWIWRDNQWWWVLQRSRHRADTDLKNSFKVDPLRGKALRSPAEAQELGADETAVRAAWDKSCQALLFSAEDIARAPNIDHDPSSASSGTMFHFRIDGEEGGASEAVWCGGRDVKGSFRQCFADNKARFSQQLMSEDPQGQSYACRQERLDRIDDLWICPVNQLMQCMVNIAAAYRESRIIRRPPRTLAPLPAAAPFKAFVCFLPPWSPAALMHALHEFFERADVRVKKIDVILAGKSSVEYPRACPCAVVALDTQEDLQRVLALCGEPFSGLRASESEPTSFYFDASVNQKRKPKKHNFLYGKSDPALNAKANPVD